MMHMNTFQVLYQNKYNINNDLEIQISLLLPFLISKFSTQDFKVEIS